MKIMICTSMAFAKEMADVKRKLRRLKHDVSVSVDIDLHLSDPTFCENLEADHKHCVKNNIIKKCFTLVAESDAILVLNYKRRGIDGYIGTSTLMEVGLAYYLNKKIFVLNKLPDWHDARWAHEVAIMQPIILNGDFSKIK